MGRRTDTLEDNKKKCYCIFKWLFGHSWHTTVAYSECAENSSLKTLVLNCMFGNINCQQISIQPGPLQVNILRWRQKSLCPINSDGFIAALLLGLFFSMMRQNSIEEFMLSKSKTNFLAIISTLALINFYSSGVRPHRAKETRFNNHCGRFPKRLEKTYSLACNTGVSNL